MKHEHRRWKVCFGKNFWGAQKGTDPGEELRIDREFEWNGRRWCIPALYRCKRGLVVDFAMEVPQEELRAYMEKWGLTEDGECTRTLSKAEQRQMEQENPLDVGFCAYLNLNGMSLHSSDGCGVGYLPGEMAGKDEAAALLHHYGLDETKVWRFWRNSYPWTTKSRKSRPKRFRTFEVQLEAELESHLAGTFRTPAVGESVTLHEPGKETAYQLTVLDIRPETLELPDNDGWELPNCFCQLTYRLTPKAESFFLSDCAEGDHPRRRPRKLPPIDPERMALEKKYGLEPQMEGDAAIAVIGGADGPTAVFCTAIGGAAEEGVSAACSACYFDPVEPERITWQAEFCRKPCADAVVSLIFNV